MPSILHLLRSETAELHAATEKELPLMSSDLHLDTYKQVLCGFWAFQQAWEHKAAAVQSAELSAFVRSRSKISLLRRDFADLGISEPEIGWLQPEVPALATPAAVLGSLYVMEGSTLGGQFIARHLVSHFGWTDRSGLHYFSGYGDATGRNWKEVCTMLENAPQAWHPPMIAAAKQTFASFRDCLRMAQAAEVRP